MREIFMDLDGKPAKSPEAAAQEGMRPQLPKRFYKQVSVGEETQDDGAPKYTVQLDGKKIKTPARQTLLLRNKKVAQIVADEWEAQEEKIDPAVMPATRLVNTACDGIRDDPQPVIEDMLKFSSSDLLCYRAADPAGLVEMQTEKWDPILDWAGDTLGARFETTQTLVLIPQPKEAVAAVSIALKQWQQPVAIAALHTFTNLTGSIILALAIAKKHINAQEAWVICHVDEDWNESTWGEDFEAKKRRDNRWRDMETAYKLFRAIDDGAE